MPLNSVNTNVGAMIALQNLNSTTSELAVVQGRINTGKKVSSAKDNGAVWAIAQSQRSESTALNSVRESLQRGASTVDVAIAAGESISDLLLQMKEKSLAAMDETLNADARTALATDYKALAAQIGTVVKNAEFNGANLLTAAGTDNGKNVKALANTKTGTTGVDASQTIDVNAVDFAYGGTTIQFTAGTDFTTAATAKTQAALVDASIKAVSTALTQFGTGAKKLSTHLSFVTKLQDSLDAGVGDLVDADLAKESARLQALQTKQQLGVQALSIANSSSSTLLGLFR
jgi:flagellin